MGVNEFGLQKIKPSTPNEFLFGKKPTKKTTKKTKKRKKPTKRVRIGSADFTYLWEKQNGLCANKKCRSLHGVRQKVTAIKDIDHKYPVRLWELKRKKGNVNARSNLQLLCTDCHRRKTQEDHKKIAQYKREHPPKPHKSGRKTQPKSLFPDYNKMTRDALRNLYPKK